MTPTKVTFTISFIFKHFVTHLTCVNVFGVMNIYIMPFGIVEVTEKFLTNEALALTIIKLDNILRTWQFVKISETNSWKKENLK